MGLLCYASQAELVSEGTSWTLEWAKAADKPYFHCVLLEKGVLFGRIHRTQTLPCPVTPQFLEVPEKHASQSGHGLAAPWEERKQNLASTYGSVGWTSPRQAGGRKRRKKKPIWAYGLCKTPLFKKSKRPGHYHQFEELPSFWGESGFFPLILINPLE